MYIKTFVLLIICATSLTLQAQSLATAENVGVVAEELNGVMHFEFTGREIWDYKLVRENDRQVSVEVDQLSDKSIVQLKTLKNKYIEKVEILPGVNLKHKIVFFLKENGIQSFDYVTDQPSRLIVDFFKEEPLPAKKVEKKKEATKKVAAKPVQKKKTRTPAGTDFIANEKKEEEKTKATVLDGADPTYSRFRIEDYEIKESAIIASKLNLYIHYPMLLVPTPDLDVILAQPNRYEFEISESDENKKARLLLTLFKKGKLDADTQEKSEQEKPRNAVFLKALELFRKEYPNSKYNEDLDFMEADTYFDLWLKDRNVKDFDLAISLYQKILLSIKASKYHDRTERLVGYAYMSRQDYQSAFTVFQKYVNRNPDSPHIHRAKIALAECLAKLNNPKDALKIYAEVESDSAAGVNAVEAAFRMGDIYAVNKEYDKAIKEYEKALQKYSADKKNYPNAYYNTAESRFWLDRTKDNLKKSLNEYIEFLEKYPKNEHASYAMERIGEILEMLGAPEEKYTGAFKETIYRYNNSQAAGVARIRMLRAQIPHMKEKDVEDEINKVKEFIKTSDLQDLKEFKTIMISDGYHAAKNYDAALKNLISFYQENPLSKYLDVLKKRIVQATKDQMNHSVIKGDYLKVFQIYGQNAGTWLKGSDRIDTHYLLGLSFEKSGVPDEAQKKYQEVLNRLYSIRGTQEEKERAVFESLPSIDEVNLRLAAVHTFKNEFGRAQDNLKEVNEKSLKSDEEKIEKVYLSSIVNEKLNNKTLAIKNLRELTETWRGNPDKLSSVYLRLAKLQSESKDMNGAISTLDKLLNMSKDSSIVSDEDQMQAFRMKAEFAMDLKKTETAKEAYRQLLDNFEDRYPLYSVRYQLGKIHFDKGEVKEAEKVWSALQDKSDAQLWSKLAQENLKNSNWNSEYKKYTNRIPAMAPEYSKDAQKGEKK